MPDSRKPGVSVKEIQTGLHTIEGVDTSTAAFVGPTRTARDEEEPEILTSFAEFERIYGGLDDPIRVGGRGRTNFVAHAVRAFFLEGGTRCYVVGSLQELEGLEGVSIVACPGYSAGYETGADRREAERIQADLVAHCEKMRHRVALLDCADHQSVSEVRQYGALVDSSHAALYYPWITIEDPVARTKLNLPPSGFVAGIYARTDEERGVHEAPAGEPVRSAVGFEREISDQEQELLNPEGINCFRTIEGRGHMLWGARTLSSDPEWKYVNVRRYFIYLEESIQKGTEFAVFEPNGDLLWSKVQQTVENFLSKEWRSGALQGSKAEEAFFVRCDRTTMTDADIQKGRLICLVGVAPLRPAEFVIFRIGQKTGQGA